jgi:hypothetical protein
MEEIMITKSYLEVSEVFPLINYEGFYNVLIAQCLLCPKVRGAL